MQYTKNYHLPQWVKDDRIMMDDFNQMCRDMEAGLNKTAADAASAAAAVSASAAAAQTTAELARAAAAAAQATANAAYCPSNKPYSIGLYTGTNEDQTITVGFQPQFVLIISIRNWNVYNYFMAAGGGIGNEYLQFTPTGFKVKPYLGNSGASAQYPPQLNLYPEKYVYIAFR